MAANMTAMAVPTSSAAAASSPISTPSHAQTVHTYEKILHRALLKSNRIAKVGLSVPLDEENVEMTHQIATAKMLNYCIRMLHADGWHPPTILRAMALRESGLERGMRGTMFQALHERQKEIEVYRLKKAVARGAGTGSGGDASSGHGQAMYNAGPSPTSSRSSGGNGGSGESGSGSGSDHRIGRNGRGIGGPAMRRRYARGQGGYHSHVHSHARGMVHPHTDLHPQNHSLVAAEPVAELANDIPINNSNQHLRTNPIIANGAVTQANNMTQMGGNVQPASLI